MVRLTDPDVLARYHRAMEEWSVEGYVELTDRAQEELRTDRLLASITQKAFKEMLYRHVVADEGEIDQVKEDREGWREKWEYHYDLRPIINGVKFYVETRLFPEAIGSRDAPMIYVVRIKPA